LFIASGVFMDPRDEKGKIWHNGKLIDWWDAKIHVMSHVVHYGSSFFEGIRCYESPKGPVIFRLSDHIRRLINSAKIYRTQLPFSEQELIQACVDVIKANKVSSAYLRPIALRGYNTLGVDPTKCPVEVYIALMNWGAYLGSEALANGVDVCVSSWNRIHANTLPSLAKVGGNYLGSQLIKMEAMADGYIEGIALDCNGFVSEGSGENIFIIKDNILYTPPAMSSSILPGITRDSVMTIIKDLGYQLKEIQIPREFLYLADEVFFTGTAAEVTPIRSIDRVIVGAGKRGPITEKIQQRFFDIINLKIADTDKWLTLVN
jgi:branched-chain amino acid aminotransferase